MTKEDELGKLTTRQLNLATEICGDYGMGLCATIIHQRNRITALEANIESEQISCNAYQAKNAELLDEITALESEIAELPHDSLCATTISDPCDCYKRELLKQEKSK